MTSIKIDRLDGLSSSVAIKGPCRVVATANILLTGLQTIDGVSLEAGDRVLVAGQVSASENGIYVVDTGPWRRSRDFNKTRDVVKGTQILITDGTVYAQSGWYVASEDPIYVGSSDITILQNIILNPAQLELLVQAAQEAADAAQSAETAAEDAADRAATAAASINLPTISTGDPGQILTVKGDKSGYEYRTAEIVVTTRTILKNLPIFIQSAYLIEAGREGTFVLKAGSPPVTDTQEGVYVVSNTAGYYWERVFGAGQAPDITAFGAKQDGVIDDTAAIQGSLDVLGFANVLEWKGARINVNTIRLKNYGDCLQGFGWPRLVTGAGTVCTIENSFQTFHGFQIEGTLQTLGTPAVRLKTDLRGMTTINVSDLYLINCGAGIMDMNSGTNKAIFVNFRDITMEGHRGYGISTWDCWASYHIDQVVVDRVGTTGTGYNYPAFYFYGAEGIFFRNCAHNGSAATSLQTLQDGAVFDNCNFVVFENFIPDHSGGRGMAFLQCANVKGGDTTLVNCGGHGFVASGGSIFDLNSVTATQFASGSVNSDGFNVDTVLGFRARGLYATGFKRNGFLGNVLTRANVHGDFSNNSGRGIVTTGAGLVNVFHDCVTAGNTAGNYSVSGTTDYIRDHIVNAGTIGDATGPASA